MSPSYSLAAKFCSEFMGMMLTIFIGEAILANELLQNTKGHGLGFLGVSLGFGFAFGLNIAWFGWISAHLNPAMFFFLALLGKLDEGWTEFVVGSAADFLGAFCGACLVVLYFGPHFSILPLPPDMETAKGGALLLDGPAGLETNAGRFASAFGNLSNKPANGSLGTEIKNFFTSNDDEHQISSKAYDPVERERLLEMMEVRHRKRMAIFSQGGTEPLLQTIPLKRRHSAQIAGLLHQKDPKMTTDGTEEDGDIAESRHSVQVAALLHTHDVELEHQQQLQHDMEMEDCDCDNVAKPEKHAVYAAALDADANAKLSIFATRPAIYNRPVNFMQEALATAMLVFGAEMFNLRKEMQKEYQMEELVSTVDGPMIHTLWISFFIAALILGLGGPTGLAVNPARDIGPRLAHALLPLPGKGSSEWSYGAVVPLWAPFVGATLAAGLFRAMQLLYESGDDP